MGKDERATPGENTKQRHTEERYKVEARGGIDPRDVDDEGNEAKKGEPKAEAELGGEGRIGSAYGIRTRVTGVRGRRPRPLDECATLSRTAGDAVRGADYRDAFSALQPQNRHFLEKREGVKIRGESSGSILNRSRGD